VTHKHNARLRRSLVGVMALAVALAASTSAAVPAGAAPGRATADWDGFSLPIATRVAQLRGLAWKHPVRVDQFDDVAFEIRQASAGHFQSPDQRTHEQHTIAELRALGLLGDNIRIIDDLGPLGDGTALAFYDPINEIVTVRSSIPEEVRRVVVAHELTHALDDQYFGIRGLQDGATTTEGALATKSLIEGDAVRIQHLYAMNLPRADRAALKKAYDAWQNNFVAPSRFGGNAEILQATEFAPYLLGNSLVRNAAAKTGNKTADKLFAAPLMSTHQLFEPQAATTSEQPVAVAPPVAHPGEEVLEPAGSFGQLLLFLVLSSRVDWNLALTEADRWAGDSAILVTKFGVSCVRARFATHRASDLIKLAGNLADWADALGSEASTTISRSRTWVQLDACHQGVVTNPAQGKIKYAVQAAALRSAVSAQMLEQHKSPAVAECIGTAVATGNAALVEATDQNQIASADAVSSVSSAIKSAELSCH
jgi:hypothetical protein